MGLGGCSRARCDFISPPPQGWCDLKLSLSPLRCPLPAPLAFPPLPAQRAAALGSTALFLFSSSPSSLRTGWGGGCWLWGCCSACCFASPYAAPRRRSPCPRCTAAPPSSPVSAGRRVLLPGCRLPTHSSLLCSPLQGAAVVSGRLRHGSWHGAGRAWCWQRAVRCGEKRLRGASVG